MKQTIAEKILSAHAGKDLEAGDFAICKIDFAFGQDGTSSIIIDRVRKWGLRISRPVSAWSLITALRRRAKGFPGSIRK